MTEGPSIGAVRTEPVRVLFVAADCSLQNYTRRTELAAWYEGVLADCCEGRLQVAIAFGDAGGQMRERMAAHEIPLNPRVTYLPLDTNLSYGAIGEGWDHARRALLEAIDQFRPDVIQCLGSEWPYGAIAEDVSIPVVIHMMGFLNIYYPSTDMANGYTHEQPQPKRRSLRFWRSEPEPVVDEFRALCERNAEFERCVMRANRYFMGRTEWDRNIVRYYAPGSQYFQVSECIKHPFVRHAGSWRYHFGGKLRLLTVSTADDRKGNTVILQTAMVLKETLVSTSSGGLPATRSSSTAMSGVVASAPQT